MAHQKIMPIPKGAIFTISTGEYSDYCVRGVFRAKETIDTETILDTWRKTHPDQRYFEESDFLASLSSILEPIDAFEWHLYDYWNNTDEMYVTRID